jgi:CSLREA domain-containing protein
MKGLDRLGAPRVARVLVLAASLVALALPAGAQGATTITVNTTADELNADGDCSLREAIQAANTNAATDACPAGSGPDSIAFRSNVRGTIALTLGELSITETLTIRGPGPSKLAVSGNNSSRVFNITAGSAQILGLRITGGNGGGIANFAALTLKDSRVDHNTATLGGGIHTAPSSTLTLERSLVSENQAIEGGGIYAQFGSGTVTLRSSQVRGNTAQLGGGINNRSDDFTLTGTQVSGNTASLNSGGIRNQSGTMRLRLALVSGNKAPVAAGISTSGTLTVEGSTVSGNTATQSGGGIVGANLNTAITTVRLSLVVGNTAGRAGGLFNGGLGGTMTVEGSLVSGNRATTSAGGGIWNEGTFSLRSSRVLVNTAETDGGGIVNPDGGLTVDRTELRGNRAKNDGGGLWNGSAASLTNSQVRQNRADSDGNNAGTGGGIFNSGFSLVLTNTPVLQNLPNNCAGAPTTPPC